MKFITLIKKTPPGPPPPSPPPHSGSSLFRTQHTVSALLHGEWVERFSLTVCHPNLTSPWWVSELSACFHALLPSEKVNTICLIFVYLVWTLWIWGGSEMKPFLNKQIIKGTTKHPASVWLAFDISGCFGHYDARLASSQPLEAFFA